jgi:hypothetical protein
MANYDLIGYGSGKIHKPSSSDHLRIGDTSRIKIGAGEDLEIYHDGSNSFLANETGALNIATLESGIAVNIGHSTSEVTIGDNLTVTGNLTVNGSTTTVNSTTLQVDDKNLELGTVDTPTDTTADGGGITLKGATDHTILWTNSTDSWDFSEHVNAIAGKEFKINNVSVLSATTLGSSVVGSSLTSVGALDSGSITSGFTSIDVGAGAITTTGLGTFGSLAVDDVVINGTTIGHTNDTDLLTLTNGLVTVAGEISVTTLDIGGTNVTATAAELNYLDDDDLTAADLTKLAALDATAAEINLLNASAGSSVTLADGDAIIIGDSGSSNQTKKALMSDVKTYVGTIAAGSVAADDITTGNAEVNVATSFGAIIIDSPTGVGTKVTEPLGSTASLSSGDIVSFQGASAGRLLDPASRSGSSTSEVFGVALELIDGAGTYKIATVWGTKVTVNKPDGDDSINIGKAMYLDTAGKATSSVPTSGTIYRVGYTVAASNDTNDTVEIAWMPQFIAEL